MDTDEDAVDEIRVAQPNSWQARGILAAIGVFTLAGVVTWTPLDLPTTAWTIAYFTGLTVVVGLGAVLPFYAAISGADVAWRLRADHLVVSRKRPFWRSTRHVIAGHARAVAVVLSEKGGPERVAVRLELADGTALTSPDFDDPLDAEWFADAVATALDLPPPANLIPPGVVPQRTWSPWPGRRRGEPAPRFTAPAAPLFAVPTPTPDDGPTDGGGGA